LCRRRRGRRRLRRRAAAGQGGPERMGVRPVNCRLQKDRNLLPPANSSWCLLAK
jgi:hypothetical protein